MVFDKISGFLYLNLCRALAPGMLNSEFFRFQTLQHVMRMTRTWDSTMSMLPRGGDTIWGGLDWSPEEGYSCSNKKQQTSDTPVTQCNEDGSPVNDKKRGVNYGRIISFGQDIAETPSTEIGRIDFKVLLLL